MESSFLMRKEQSSVVKEIHFNTFISVNTKLIVLSGVSYEFTSLIHTQNIRIF